MVRCGAFRFASSQSHSPYSPPTCSSGSHDRRLNEMREFFKGWRRMAGCVALVMAILLGVSWIRSQSVADVVSTSIGPRGATLLVSLDGCIGWSVYERREPQRLTWEIKPRSDLAGLANEPLVGWYWQLLGFRIGRSPILGTVATIPYWSLVVPLTMISAYLILWKPRPKVEHDA